MHRLQTVFARRLHASASVRNSSGLVNVHIDTATKVAIVKLNDPARLNALTVPMGEAFQSALKGIDYTAVNALVLTGEGKAFSAGGDLEFLKARSRDSPSHNADVMRAFYSRYLQALRAVPVPTVAAINGHAIGAGLCLALGADVRLAAEGAKLGVTFVGLALHPGMAATYNLPRLIGPQLAARLLLTGDTVSGSEAAAMGLVAQATKDGETVSAAAALAARMAAQAPLAVRATVKTLRQAQDEGLERALQREADAQAQSYASKDLAEGVDAVGSKRKPVWRGE